MRIVSIESIPKGSLLGKTLYDNNGNLLLKAGTILDNTIINEMKNFNITSLYIIDSYNKNEIQHIIRPDLQSKLESFDLIDETSNKLLNNVTDDNSLLTCLLDIRNMDNYTYMHCINVGVISLLIGIKLKLDIKKLENLFIGALLHDIGKLFIPKDIINKSSSLTFEEFELIKEHPRIGYNYLRENLRIDSPYTLIVLQHHERIDGNGYPYNLTATKIDFLSKIVSIADVYDALSSARPYKSALCTDDVLDYITDNAGTMFDNDLVYAFIKST